MQLDGFAAVAEYGSRFEADLAADRLAGDGIATTVLSDPAHQIAPHIVTHRGHSVLVADRDIDHATALLAHDDSQPLEADLAAVGLARRPRWFRWMAFMLAGATLGPFAYGLIDLLVRRL